jgi:hypothetical protein
MVIDYAQMPAALQARSCHENRSGRDGTAEWACKPIGVNLTHAAQAEIGKPKAWQGATAQNSITTEHTVSYARASETGAVTFPFVACSMCSARSPKPPPRGCRARASKPREFGKSQNLSAFCCLSVPGLADVMLSDLPTTPANMPWPGSPAYHRST